MTTVGNGSSQNQPGSATGTAGSIGQPKGWTVWNVFLALIVFGIGAAYCFRHFWYLAPHWVQGFIGVGVVALGTWLLSLWRFLKQYLGNSLETSVAAVLAARLTTGIMVGFVVVETVLMLTTSSICLRYGDKNENRSFSVRVMEDGKPFRLAPLLKIEHTAAQDVAGAYFFRPTIGRHSLRFEVLTPDGEEPPVNETFHPGSRIDLSAPFQKPDLHVLMIVPGPHIYRRLPPRDAENPVTTYGVSIAGKRGAKTSDPFSWSRGVIITGGENKYLPEPNTAEIDNVLRSYNAHFHAQADKEFIAALFANGRKLSSPRFEGDEDVSATITPVQRGKPPQNPTIFVLQRELCEKNVCFAFIDGLK